MRFAWGLLLLAGCSDGRPGFEILQEGRPLALEVVYRSPPDPWPAAAPVAGRPPEPPRPPSLRLLPGLPLPQMADPHWRVAYQFDAPQARAALEALGEAGVLDRAVKTAPPPSGPAYLLRIGMHESRHGGFHERHEAELGGPAETRRILAAVRARLSGPVAAEVEAFLETSLPD